MKNYLLLALAVFLFTSTGSAISLICGGNQQHVPIGDFAVVGEDGKFVCVNPEDSAYYKITFVGIGGVGGVNEFTISCASPDIIGNYGGIKFFIGLGHGANAGFYLGSNACSVYGLNGILAGATLGAMFIEK